MFIPNTCVGKKKVLNSWTSTDAEFPPFLMLYHAFSCCSFVGLSVQNLVFNK